LANVQERQYLLRKPAIRGGQDALQPIHSV